MRRKSRRATRRLVRGGGWFSCTKKNSCKVNEPTRVSPRISTPKSETRREERTARRENRAAEQAERSAARAQRAAQRAASRKRREENTTQYQKERTKYHMKRLINSKVYNNLSAEEKKKAITEHAFMLAKQNTLERIRARPLNENINALAEKELNAIMSGLND